MGAIGYCCDLAAIVYNFQVTNMIQSFIVGGVFRFLLRFIPSVFETIVEHMKYKQSIEHDRLKLELAKINAENLVALERIKDKPVILARIHEHKHKSGIKWIDGFNALIRPLTTVFLDYCLSVISMVERGKNFVIQSPLAVLTPFEQEIIACIRGFWYSVK
ncbi:hypothetical protein G293_02330 [Candidatus Liberibacter africanus PTSAPSY]|uniref:Uncharacterized protein n=1 Tax=Candidatus Liberibacter africanus PTSAPSY TaxID=1277257 RepID=A0A0G3I6H3_LIBAF|nr:hypothetical protein G293_02330 [Candidatus Liberibacter africanus PTSAPSY]